MSEPAAIFFQSRHSQQDHRKALHVCLSLIGLLALASPRIKPEMLDLRMASSWELIRSNSRVPLLQRGYRSIRMFSPEDW